MDIKKGRKERKFNEELILSYKETSDDDKFTKIMNDTDIKKYVSAVAMQKLKNAPTTLHSFEDLYNLGFLIIWQSIHKYRFICPKCGIKAKTYSMYKLHTTVKHGEYLEPHTSISQYLKFNLGSYLQNEIRGEYSYSNKTNVMTIGIFSGLDEGEEGPEGDSLEYDLVSDFNLEDIIIFEDSIRRLKEKLDPQTQKIFSFWFDDGLKQQDIAAIFYERGYYSSEQSAAVVVSRTIKQKITPMLSNLYPEIFK